MRALGCSWLVGLLLGSANAAAAPVSTSSTSSTSAASTEAPRAPMLAPPGANEAPARAIRRRPPRRRGGGASARFGVGLFGHLGGPAFTAADDASWRERARFGLGGGAFVGFGRWEWLSKVSLTLRGHERRAAPSGAVVEVDQRGLFALSGPRVDLDGAADGLGFHVGANFGVIANGGALERRRDDPRCVDCAAIRDWRVGESFVTLAFVPSALYRHALTDGAFRIALELEAQLWLGGRSHSLEFAGDATPEAVAAFEALQDDRASGFYGAFVVDVGLRFGLAADLPGDRVPAGSGGTRTERPPPSRRTPPRSR